MKNAFYAVKTESKRRLAFERKWGIKVVVKYNHACCPLVFMKKMWCSKRVKSIRYLLNDTQKN